MSTLVDEVHYDGVHCNVRLEKFSNPVVLLQISGTDIGEFGDAPMLALDKWVAVSGPIQLFIDARHVKGASMEVSSEWANWLSSRRESLQSVTMLTGSRLIHITAGFVRRAASLEGLMYICTEPIVFDTALAEALQN